MLRREFFAQLAGVSALTMGCGGSAWAYRNRHHHAPHMPPSKLDRIAVSSWSLHNYFSATREQDFTLPGTMLALLDFPEAIVDRYSVRHFEFCASQFPSMEPAFVHEMKYTLTHMSSSVVNLAIDIDACGPEGTFSDPNREARLAALEMVQSWIGIAHGLGAKSVSVGPGRIDPENLDRTVEAYKSVVNYAQGKGIHVTVENQNGFGDEHPEELEKVIRLAGAGRLGTLPNFANFPDDATRNKGLKMFLPLASTTCHVGGLGSSVDGTGTGYDFSPALEVARQSGFDGYYTIAFNGPGDPYPRIQKTIDELLKFL